MKKWIAIALIASILLVLLPLLYFYTGSDQTVSDVETLEEQVLADYIKKNNLPKDTEFETFQYYGTDNGYHIVLYRKAGPHASVAREIDVAGYRFEGLGSGGMIVAYKNGHFIRLPYAHYFRLISKEAIAKAAELHAANKNATK